MELVNCGRGWLNWVNRANLNIRRQVNLRAWLIAVWCSFSFLKYKKIEISSNFTVKQSHDSTFADLFATNKLKNMAFFMPKLLILA